MRHTLAFFLVALGFGGYLFHQAATTANAQEPHASVIVVDGVIDPTTASFLSRGIETAFQDGSRLVIIELDTPGGLLASTREMVETILAAPIPVIVFVSPQGAQAASAGTFIAAAGHVAAMAPGTNIGAASPVGIGGEDLPDTLKTKVTEDTAAFIRSIADARGRNSDALEQTVLKAKSFSSSEALEANLIDLIAANVPDLMTQLDGRTVLVDASSEILDTNSLAIRNIDRTPVEQFIGFIANPNIAFILLTLGGIGLVIELFSPGLVGPGAVGVICLILAFLALGNLPVNWVGVGLIVVAMGLFYAETQAPGLGIFGGAGAVGFLIGAFLLFGEITPSAPDIPQPNFRVSIWLIGAVGAAVFGSVFLMFKAARDAKSAPQYEQSGTRNLVSEVATTVTPLTPYGTIRISGETWSAVSDNGEAISQGEHVIVSDIDGLTLKVFRSEEVKG